VASRLRESDEFSETHVVGWESRDGTYHAVYDADDNKVGREPTDRSLESADRVVFVHEGDYYTVGALSDDYELDDAIAELEDLYG
jgi:hypothetical protein